MKTPDLSDTVVEKQEEKAREGLRVGALPSLLAPLRGERALPYWLILPLVLLLFFVTVFPFLWNIWVSLHDLRSINILRGAPFIGLKNYIRLFQDSLFYHSLHISLYFVVGSIIGQFSLGLLIALIFHRRPRAARFLRPVFIIPWILSAIIIGYSWIWMYNYNFGLINSALRALGLAPIRWLNDITMAIWALVIANIWRGTPFTMLFLEAALKNIPDELYEAAQVDGASAWQSFRHVTLPMLRPAITINLILVTMWTFNLFDTILVMTQGGPANATLTTAMYMYNNAFRYGLFGYGAAITLIMLLINVILAVLYFRTVGRTQA